MKNDIYIIIVTYNGMRWLKKCLDSTTPYPVVVVDNNSQDESVSFIKQNYPEVHVLEQKENLGFGRSNNLGIKYAIQKNCSAVFLLNQDAYLYPDTIAKLYGYYMENPEYGLLSPIHLDGKGEKLDRNFSNYMIYDHNSDFYSDALLRKLEGCYTIPFVNAAAWFLPRKSLDEVGGFDPIFHHYGEDDNYCQRLLYHGKKIGVLANTWVRHDRIYRNKDKAPFSNQDYFRKSEYHFKREFANITQKLTKKEEKYPLERQFLKALMFFLKGKFNKARENFKLYILQRKWFKEIMHSKSKNKHIGSHYI